MSKETTLALYELTDELYSAIDQLSDMEDDDEAKIDTLDALAIPVKDKAVSVIKFTENLDTTIDGINKTMKQMKDRLVILKKKKDMLKKYVFQNLNKVGIDKIECAEFVISIQKNPPKVEVYNEEMIPGIYINKVVTEKVDKKSIKEAINGGNDVPGAKMVQERSLRIK